MNLNINKRTLAFFLTILCLACFGAADSGEKGAVSATVYFSWWYIIGGYAAVLYRNIVSTVKQRLRGKFKFYLLILPLAVNSLVAVPLVLTVIGMLGPPSASPVKNLFTSFTAVYAIMDVTWFLYKVSTAVDDYAKEKGKE